MAARRTMRLNRFLSGDGRHEASWRHAPHGSMTGRLRREREGPSGRAGPVRRAAAAGAQAVLLQTGQAALGLIGPDLLGIAVELRTDAIVLHFAISAHAAEVDEDIEDIYFELDALLSGGPEELSELSTQIHVGRPDDTWPGRSHALLHLAKVNCR